MDAPITRAEYEEFRRRMDDDAHRQDKRIELLEESIEKTHLLALSVERLAVSMESMCKEQEKQGKRLEALEGEDGEKWRKVVGYIITAVIGITLGFIFRQIGM